MSEPLPTCRHRGARLGRDRYECGSQHLVHDGSVPASICRACPFADAPNPTQPEPTPIEPERHQTMPCPHRGEFRRQVECPTCTGSVKVKTFACAKHGECTQRKAAGGVPACDHGPKLTIGMATRDDFHGVYFTVKALQIFHADMMADVEILVVDNNPEGAHGKQVSKLMKKAAGQCWQTAYVPFAGQDGTAQPRNAVFDYASAPAILCLDSHVLMHPGSIRRLIDYFDQNPDSGDLLQGPIVLDNGDVGGTHQNLRWRGNALGTWGTDPRGLDPDGEPFEIAQQGMGCFASRKDAWVRFHADMRGFGGCETYIAAKYRAAGHRVLCCPWLRWTHRFPRPEGAYEIKLPERVRNYLLGFMDLGMDLWPALAYFRDKLSPQQWQQVVKELEIEDCSLRT